MRNLCRRKQENYLHTNFQYCWGRRFPIFLLPGEYIFSINRKSGDMTVCPRGNYLDIEAFDTDSIRFTVEHANFFSFQVCFLHTQEKGIELDARLIKE